MAAKKKRSRKPVSTRAKPRRSGASIRKPSKKKAKKAANPRRTKKRAGKTSRAPSKTGPRAKAKVKAKAKAKSKAKPKAKHKTKAMLAGRAPKAKRRKRLVKPKRPPIREDYSLLWQGYFHDVLSTVKERLRRHLGVVLPSHVKTWHSNERADGLLTIDIGEAPEAAHEVQKAINDALIDYATKGGFFISFAYSGMPGGQDSPTLSQAGATAETWPTQDLDAAIDTAEGTRRIPGVLRSVGRFLDIASIKVRLHWNPFEEQPERMA